MDAKGFIKDMFYRIKKGVFILPFFLLLITHTPVDAKEQVKFLQQINSSLEEPIDVAVSYNNDIYALDRDLAKVFVFSEDGKLKQSFGEKGTSEGALWNPKSIALSSKGEIMIADTGNNRIMVYNSSGHYSYQLGNMGSGEGEFKKPIGVALDPHDNIFVVDASLKRISKFSPRGVYLKSWALNHQPDDVVIDRQGHTYIMFKDVGKIIKYSPELKKIKEMTLVENEEDYVASASAMAVDMRGDIYLIGSKGHSIKKIDQQQNLLFGFGSNGIGRGQFDQPSGITSDNNGRIYISDKRNKRIQVFEVTGRTTEMLETSPAVKPEVDFDRFIYTGEKIADLDFLPEKGLYALSDYKGHILFKGDVNKVYGKSDDEVALLSYPKALHVMADGRMLVADTGSHQIKFLSADGEHEYHFGKRGSQQSQFNGLEGVAVNQDGFIYVADTKNHRIQIFNSDGIYLESFGKASELTDEFAAEPGSFLRPTDLVFDSLDRLYVLDSLNKRIQIFDTKGKFIKAIGGKLNDVQFKEPVDIALDENNYLYVADRGANKVHIFDNRGQWLAEFGSIGQGPSHFPRLAAIESWGGKIYVADYKADAIKVFKFDHKLKSELNDRLFITKTSQPLKMEHASSDIKQKMARKLTLNEAKEELARKLNVAMELLTDVRVESEEILPNGQVKLTISAPKLDKAVNLISDHVSLK